MEDDLILRVCTKAKATDFTQWPNCHYTGLQSPLYRGLFQGLQLDAIAEQELHVE